MDRLELVFRPRAVALWSATAIALLVALHTASQILRFSYGHDHLMGLAREVYLGGEGNIPNWFSTLLILVCAVVLLVIARASRGRPFHRHWFALGVIFVLLSLDEAAALHDLTAPMFAGLFGNLARTVGGPFVAYANKPNYAWLVGGVLVCVTVGISYLRFLAALPRTARAWFAASGAVYVFGAVGIDAIEGWYSGTWGPRTPIFAVLVTCEETLEMVGMTMFLYALLSYAEQHIGELRVRIGARAAAPTARFTADTPARSAAAATLRSS